MKGHIIQCLLSLAITILSNVIFGLMIKNYNNLIINSNELMIYIIVFVMGLYGLSKIALSFLAIVCCAVLPVILYLVLMLSIGFVSFAQIFGIKYDCDPLGSKIADLVFCN